MIILNIYDNSDEDDRDDLKLRNNARSMAVALTDIRNHFRSKMKHEELKKSEYKIYEQLSEKIQGFIFEAGVDFDLI